MTSLEERVFESLCEQVRRHSAQQFDARRQAFFARRVAQRMQAVGAASAAEYCHALAAGRDPLELDRLSESLTTNETYFFREHEQLRAFADCALGEVLARKRAAGERELRLWSAGCASGEEPYTLAIILREVIEDFDRWRIAVSATDISHGMLETAGRALYGERAVRCVPEAYRARHFQPEGEALRLAPAIRRMVRLQRLNLNDAAAVRAQGPQDFIFCRNVLIYFDDASMRRLLDLFYDLLAPGGFVFLGHSESVGRITSAFELVGRGGQLLYRKPEGGS